MIIYPAVDIKDGKCVRLVQGKTDNTTIYYQEPLEAALRWQTMGAKFLHVVDLDGAFEGRSRNLEVIRQLCGSLSIPIQMGGGIRSLEMVEYVLESIGIRRVILGTAAVKDPDLLQEAIRRYGERIIVGIDARDGKAALEGWMEESNISALELAQRMEEIGLKTIVYTDINRDGMLTGPNLEAAAKMIRETNLDVIASGGVGCLEDVEDLHRIGAAGAIIGKALYTGKVDLKSALQYEEG